MFCLSVRIEGEWRVVLVTDRRESASTELEEWLCFGDGLTGVKLTW